MQIFNRYEKHLITLKHKNSSWDGTFNGINLPGDDY
ncbi:T9SS type B sorting domain-containing protein [Winogradskyella sp.]